jgi:hypothetical protein
MRPNAKRSATEDIGILRRPTQIHRVNRGNYHFVSDVIADYFRSGTGLGGAG